MLTIRLKNYRGDLDDLYDVYLIGPYVDTATRDHELGRLTSLPGVHGNVTLHQSTAPPSLGDYSADPDRVAGVRDLDELMDAFAA